MKRQCGSILLALVAMIALTVSTVVLARLGSTAQRDARTAVALAQAREALIAFALTVAPDTAAKRPGDLPCPDLDNDGDAEATCVQAGQRIGRLPWKTLAIPDLRDSAGERLWYAVSARFKRNNTNACPAAGGAGCLNSDTSGTLTLRDAQGSLLHDGAAASGAIALVVAPGAVLTRLGETSVQARTCTGDADLATCASTGRCSSTATPLCNPANYLDRVGPPVLTLDATPGGAEDNADIVESQSGNGFIQGPIRDAQGEVVLNDRISAVRHEDILPRLEQRVAHTALRCLSDYSTLAGGRFPWAAAVGANYASPLSDQPALTFGRLPNSLANTGAQPGMPSAWPASCPLAWSSPPHKWWANWQNLVFVAIAPAFAPDSAAAECGACLDIAPSASGRHVVVLVAGRVLAGQVRGVGVSAAAYLEGSNPGGGPQFTAGPPAAGFNDAVVSQ